MSEAQAAPTSTHPKPKRRRKRRRSAHKLRLELRRDRPTGPAEPLSNWREPDGFAEALDLHMRRHGETCEDLWRAILRRGDRLEPSTIVSWRRGRKAPRTAASLRYLARIEERYDLPAGYFRAKFPHRSRATTGHALGGISLCERRRLAWHLPDDFDDRPAREQEEILDWVRRVIVSGATPYRRYQAAAMRHRYAIRFPNLIDGARDEERDERAHPDPELAPGRLNASPRLAAEMAALVRFKTSTLTQAGYRRRGVWGPETAAQKIEHLALMLGALAASPHGPVAGFGAPVACLSLAHLAFPAVWDWYVRWRERRRGFYTVWEIDMLSVAVALTARETGWLTQTPALIDQLCPIPGLVGEADIPAARSDWAGACAAMHAHAMTRAKEIERVARVHRDPFEPILPILEADSPLAEYRKIADEIVRLMPDASRYPKSAAEARRSLLMIRFGLHLGLRQKNLRQLLVCRRGAEPSSERQLEDRRRGELRWSERDKGWEVLIPAVALKNAHSSFFAGRPFRLVLPDLCGLYAHIDRYLEHDRALLLGPARDPGAFFIKTVKRSSAEAAYNQTTFYEAWRLTIQRYGVFNPYTGRGAIAGLLPHGPHNVRDVLATHILKVTGSFEQASYAIQDTPEIVARHYGRFLPENKASLAARVLNQVWQDD
ncbi:MAG: hypothetical protein ACREH4_07345 [Vitreimonas sp.]